jgi:colanic acid biosynthesis glycosyl transferase WcaI
VFHDFMPFEQVANWLLDADIGVVPMWADLVPNKLLEYLMLGIPAITSDCRALRLYLDDSCVVYVPPRDARALAQAIVDLYRDPKRRLSIATNGHEAYQERLSWERSRHDYLSIYGVNGRAHGGTEVSAKAGNPPA